MSSVVVFLLCWKLLLCMKYQENILFSVILIIVNHSYSFIRGTGCCVLCVVGGTTKRFLSTISWLLSIIEEYETENYHLKTLLQRRPFLVSSATFSSVVCLEEIGIACNERILYLVLKVQNLLNFLIIDII